MKAVVVEKIGTIAIRNLPSPPMGDYEARCDLLFGSVCTGTDRHLLNGRPPFCHWVQLPFILGHESVGRVVEVGAKVRTLKVGDLITRVGCPATGGTTPGWGGFAEEGIATDWRAMRDDGVEGWQDKQVQQVLPPNVDPADATLFITWRETLSYLRRMAFAPKAHVLVVGSGGVGLAFVSHARNLGAANVVCVGAAGRADVARRAGASACHDYRDETWRDGLRDGFDFVIDSIGTPASVVCAQHALKPGGRIGIYGMDDIANVTLAPSKTFTLCSNGYDEAETHEDVLAFYRKGQLDPSVWIDRDNAFALTDIAKAFEAIRNRTQVKPLIRLH